MFGGIGSVSRVFSELGHVPVSYVDSDTVAANAFSDAFPRVRVHTDIDDTHVTHGADVTFATPPCADYSAAGAGRGDATSRGQLVYTHLHSALSGRPMVHVVENVGELLQFDNGRVCGIIQDIADEYGYQYEASVMSPLDYGGRQNRERCIIVLTRNGVTDIAGTMDPPVPTTPGAIPCLADILDPVADVDWYALESDAKYKPSGIVHAPDYDGPKRDWTTSKGGIGEGPYNIYAPACTLKLFDANVGGWTQVYYDDRDPDRCEHRRLSLAECCRLAKLPRLHDDACTRRMLGAGVDGYISGAVAKRTAAYLFRYWSSTSSIPPDVYDDVYDDAVLSCTPTAYPACGPIPRELRHCRFVSLGLMLLLLSGGLSSIRNFSAKRARMAR